MNDDDKIKTANDALVRQWWEKLLMSVINDTPTDELIDLEKRFRETPKARVELVVRKVTDKDADGKITYESELSITVDVHYKRAGTIN